MTTTDAWEEQLASGNSVEYGSVVQVGANAATSSTISTAYTPPQILDETPGANGATWSNSLAAAIVEKDADGSVDTIAQNADGTYSDTETLANVSNAGTGPQELAVTDNADGSGKLTDTIICAGVPLLTSANVLGFFGEIDFAAPAGGFIALQGVPTAEVNYNPPLPLTIIPPPPGGYAPLSFGATTDWVTGALAANSGKLGTDNSTLATNVTFPASCSVPATFGTTGNEVTRTYLFTDTVIGYENYIQTNTYTAAAGPVCVTLVNETMTEYDYFNDTIFAYPIADLSTLSNQLAGMQSATGTASSARKTASVKTQVARSQAAMMNATETFIGRARLKEFELRKAYLKNLVKTMQAHGGLGR